MNTQKRCSRNRTAALLAALCLACPPIVARIWVHHNSRGQIYTHVDNIPKCRVALVLGCNVRPDGRLTKLLEERVDGAITSIEPARRVSC